MEEKKNAVTETPSELQEVIQKILDIDAKAKEITSEALQSRSETEKNLEKRKLELHEHYLKRAKERIEKMRIEEQKLADAEIAATEKEHQRLIESLEQQYQDGKSGWIEEIFKQVVSI